MLYLVRHAMPMAREHVDKEKWELSPEGRSAAHALAVRLPPDACLHASNERKAWETLADAPGDVIRDARFNEIRREGEPWEGNYKELRAQYVEGRRHPGWEPHSAAADRFQQGVDAARTVADGRDVVIATHGMVMTTWLVFRGAVDADEAVDFWQKLQFPDCIAVDLDRGQLSRLTV